jgi:hypothetical protein
MTLAELSVGPHVARTAKERVARQAHPILRRSRSTLPLRVHSTGLQRHCDEPGVNRRHVAMTRR